ncbi:MAG: isocitrate/isopropylmalate family dehydrogenase, partial [Mariprofundaceae bacterium]|nr:isocitrate/isopropylmalate family dehydrogenase [Mariprofundaceae bacterium]
MGVNITVLPGDGIGREIVRESLKVLSVLNQLYGLNAEWEEAALGGDGYDTA